MQNERRRQFLIDRPLQLRYMLTITFTLLVVTVASLLAIYFGIWGNVLNAFSDDQIRNDLLTATRLEQYEEARRPSPQPEEGFSPLSFFRQAERLSMRQREVFREILDKTNQNLTGKLLLLLLLIAWGTVFLSHKIAGPLFRFQRVLNDLSEGDLTVRCKLRKYDEAQPVAEAFNQALESLNQHISRLKKIVRENENKPDVLASALKEELDKFKTQS